MRKACDKHLADLFYTRSLKPFEVFKTSKQYTAQYTKYGMLIPMKVTKKI